MLVNRKSLLSCRKKVKVTICKGNTVNCGNAANFAWWSQFRIGDLNHSTLLQYQNFRVILNALWEF